MDLFRLSGSLYLDVDREFSETLTRSKVLISSVACQPNYQITKFIINQY